MKQQISRISVHQTAKVIGVAYLLLGVLLIPVFWLAGGASPAAELPTAAAILIPVFYGIIGYLATAIFCVFYNLVAGWTGGIEITLKPEEEPL